MQDLQVAKTIFRIASAIIMMIGLFVMTHSGPIMVVNMTIFATVVVGVLILAEAILDRMAK